MPPRKSSKAEHFSARFNPATSEEDKKALEIIHKWLDEGYNFKAIAQDAILRAEGYRPEMFSDPNLANQKLLGQFEDMLARFAEDLIQQLQKRGVHTVDDDSDDDDDAPQAVSKYAKNFARGFIQRQQSGG